MRRNPPSRPTAWIHRKKRPLKWVPKRKISKKNFLVLPILRNMRKRKPKRKFFSKMVPPNPIEKNLPRRIMNRKDLRSDGMKKMKTSMTLTSHLACPISMNQKIHLTCQEVAWQAVTVQRMKKVRKKTGGSCLKQMLKMSSPKR